MQQGERRRLQRIRHVSHQYSTQFNQTYFSIRKLKIGGAACPIHHDGPRIIATSWTMAAPLAACTASLRIAQKFPSNLEWMAQSLQIRRAPETL